MDGRSERGWEHKSRGAQAKFRGDYARLSQNKPKQLRTCKADLHGAAATDDIAALLQASSSFPPTLFGIKNPLSRTNQSALSILLPILAATCCIFD